MCIMRRVHIRRHGEKEGLRTRSEEKLASGFKKQPPALVANTSPCPNGIHEDQSVAFGYVDESSLDHRLSPTPNSTIDRVDVQTASFSIGQFTPTRADVVGIGW
ncbi:hypothetical protein WG66_007119 [Moniliophthora roreri]|nr:hypothetical protein WG66_007119 [Moniliophthora roreri]